MKKAKWNEVPESYRKNYKKEFLDKCGLVLTALLFDAIVLLMILV